LAVAFDDYLLLDRTVHRIRAPGASSLVGEVGPLMTSATLPAVIGDMSHDHRRPFAPRPAGHE
jgi:hypothetical protein